MKFKLPDKNKNKLKEKDNPLKPVYIDQGQNRNHIKSVMENNIAENMLNKNWANQVEENNITVDRTDKPKNIRKVVKSITKLFKNDKESIQSKILQWSVEETHVKWMKSK